VKAGVVYIYLETYNQLKKGGLPYYFNTFNIYSNPSNQTSYLLTDLPLNFNISTVFANSPWGGFDSNCLIGLKQFSLVGNSSGSYSRSMSFDLTTEPISSIQSSLHQIDSAGTY
jgi:hypothetical protein